MNDLKHNLALLYDFYITAQEDNFTKGAQKLYLSPNNLSKKMSHLEDSLKLKLFNKTNRGISLTIDGERLYKILDKTFNNLSEFEENYMFESDQIKGSITIGTTRNIADNVLIKYLSEFEKKYPGVDVDILIDSATNLNDYLRSHKIDVLIDYLPQINNSFKMEIEVNIIDKFDTCFACSKEFYMKEANKINSIKDLKKYKLVIPGKSRRRQLLDDILQEYNMSLVPQYRMPDSKLMADFVKKNDYIGYFIDNEVIDFDLVKIDIKEQMPINSIGLIYYKHEINKITKKFIEMVLEKMKEANV